ncbi:MAG: hypothetical protein H0W27_05195 [Actinobacteria bacterium]|nr:hypothetical protein [Actinomycetota bacterium]
MPSGELVFANVLDVRQRDAEGDMANGLVYLLAVPSRALPFAVLRDWKAPTGYIAEEVQLIAPSGAVAHRIGPEARWLMGSMDLTHVETIVDDGMFRELGGYVASFVLDGEVQGQTEFQVVLQVAPEKLPKEVEDGLKKSDVAWIGVEYEGREITVPAWFVYRQGKIYVLSSNEPSLKEQTVPGIPGSDEALVILRRKLRETSLERFRASCRILEGPEWDQVASLLVDRRRSRAGPPAEALKRWKGSCSIAELTPLL